MREKEEEKIVEVVDHNMKMLLWVMVKHTHTAKTS